MKTIKQSNGIDAGKGPFEETTCELRSKFPAGVFGNLRKDQSRQREQDKQRPWGRKELDLEEEKGQCGPIVFWGHLPEPAAHPGT